MTTTLYTIGHSNQSFEAFLFLLKQHGITCIVDVRSMPASRFNPHFNKKKLDEELKKREITYLHFGEEFGARKTDPLLLNDKGRLDFEKVRQSNKFREGMERINHGISKGYRIALMCSEGDPLKCHRFAMIAPALVEKGYDVQHILKDGSVVSNVQLEETILLEYKDKLPVPDMFSADPDNIERLRAAYKIKNDEVGYGSVSKPSRNRIRNKN